ncbi:hypothetical protein BpHYR1_023986 [Brachionus plicatilis]|uniref:EF-hand domain-containing protein n=1 Tax=Brachionus plicatilis TaxID=10195 RepID=A0A3M7SHE7_BRAPC|nr:hypothetical protein BpHYR1_023986 [Brachionus plicatilis]
MSYSYTDQSELNRDQIESSVTRSIRSLYSGYPLSFNNSSASLGNGGAVLTKSASATDNNNSVSRIAQDLLELQRASRKNFNYNLDFGSLNQSFNQSFSHGQNLGPTSSHSEYNYMSNVEAAILKSNVPLETDETEEISVNGQRGLWMNKFEAVHWKGLLPINQYPINEDTNPEIVNKKSVHNLEYVQELAIRYLRPPTPPSPGEIIISQLPNTVTAPAPPLIIRQQPARPETPEPLVIREAPPSAPVPLGRKVITISGKRIPPPPRKVIIERLPPLPSKPQSVIIERWLPYDQVKRKVIFHKSGQIDPVIVKPKNVIIQWEVPQVQIKREYKYLGVIRANPVEYVQRFGNNLTLPHNLPQFVTDIKTPDGLALAAQTKQRSVYELEGDVQALNLIDLDKEGLSEYRSYLQPTLSMNSGSKMYSANTGAFSIPVASYDDSYRLSNTYSQSDNIETLIEYIFRSIDRNNSGRITVEDAEKILLRLNSRLDRKYGEDDVRAFFNALDINNDGTLDLREFKRAFLNLNNP